MRRLVAITAIGVLMFSVNSPLLAATCEHGKPITACHEVQELKPQNPHCAMMHHHDGAGEMDRAGNARPAPDSPVIRSEPSSQNCPMDCCQLGARTNAVALTVALSFPQLALSEMTPPIFSVVFSSTGFSSHTDRGPPTA